MRRFPAPSHFLVLHNGILTPFELSADYSHAELSSMVRSWRNVFLYGRVFRSGAAVFESGCWNAPARLHSTLHQPAAFRNVGHCLVSPVRRTGRFRHSSTGSSAANIQPIGDANETANWKSPVPMRPSTFEPSHAPANVGQTGHSRANIPTHDQAISNLGLPNLLHFCVTLARTQAPSKAEKIILPPTFFREHCCGVRASKRR